MRRSQLSMLRYVEMRSIPCGNSIDWVYWFHQGRGILSLQSQHKYCNIYSTSDAVQWLQFSFCTRFRCCALIRIIQLVAQSVQPLLCIRMVRTPLLSFVRGGKYAIQNWWPYFAWSYGEDKSHHEYVWRNVVQYPLILCSALGQWTVAHAR